MRPSVPTIVNSPIRDKSRHTSLDLIRGVAVMGILVMNALSFGLDEAAFTRFPKLTTGTRRPYLILPEDLRVESDTDGLRFHFTLPAGVYATTRLREFMKSDEGLPDPTVGEP